MRASPAAHLPWARTAIAHTRRRRRSFDLHNTYNGTWRVPSRQYVVLISINHIYRRWRCAAIQYSVYSTITCILIVYCTVHSDSVQYSTRVPWYGFSSGPCAVPRGCQTAQLAVQPGGWRPSTTPSVAARVRILPKTRGTSEEVKKLKL